MPPDEVTDAAPDEMTPKRLGMPEPRDDGEEQGVRDNTVGLEVTAVCWVVNAITLKFGALVRQRNRNAPTPTTERRGRARERGQARFVSLSRVVAPRSTTNK